MNLDLKELLVSRIISGSIHIEVDNKEYLIKNPSTDIRYKGNILYNRKLVELESNPSLLDDAQILDFMQRNSLWTIEDQTKLDSLPNDIENLKVQMFELAYKTSQRKEIKLILNRGRSDLNALTARRHRFDYLTARGIASISRLYYVIGSSLYYFNTDKKVYKSSKWIDRPNSIIHKVIVEYNSNFLTETTYRELARTEPWRSIWNAAKSDSLFGAAACNLSEEQKSIVFWSRMYDNIYESADCPADEIIEDDDMLDGWLIIQRRKRDRDRIQSEADAIAAKHGGANEIYIPVESIEELRRVNEMNSPGGKMVKNQRFAALKQAGTLNQADLPDVQRDLVMEANKAYTQKMRGK